MDLAMRWLFAVIVAFSLPNSVFAKDNKKKSEPAGAPG